MPTLLSLEFAFVNGGVHPFLPNALALIPLSLTKVRLSPTSTLPPLMIWCFGQTALFLFLLARTAPAFLPTALSVALTPLFPFWQAQYVQVFPLKPTPFCTLFAGLGSTNKSAISFLFSSCLTLVLSSPLISNSVADLAGTALCSIRLQWVPGHLFLSGNNAARRGALFAPSAIPCRLSPLVSSRTGGVLSHRSSLTHRFPRFSPRNFCSLVVLAVSFLVFAATDTAFF